MIENATILPTPQPREPWAAYLLRCRAEGSRHTLAQLSAIYLWKQGVTIGGEN